MKWLFLPWVIYVFISITLKGIIALCNWDLHRLFLSVMCPPYKNWSDYWLTCPQQVKSVNGSIAILMSKKLSLWCFRKAALVWHKTVSHAHAFSTPPILHFHSENENPFHWTDCKLYKFTFLNLFWKVKYHFRVRSHLLVWTEVAEAEKQMLTYWVSMKPTMPVLQVWQNIQLTKADYTLNLLPNLSPLAQNIIIIKANVLLLLMSMFKGFYLNS